MKLFKKILICTGMLLVVLGVTVGVSYATKITSTLGDTTNKISTGILSGEIVETYNAPDAMLPGDNVPDVIKVKNTGNVSCLIRLKVEKAWGSSRDANNNLISTPSDELLSTNNIILNVNSSNWIEIDGYYYYKGILNAGATSQSFIDSFDVSYSTDDSYKNKTADIRVSADIIQALGDGIVSIWGLNYSDLGITKPSDGENLGDTLVTFISPEQKFDIDASDVDLFKNFKELVPGIIRSQVIKVKNNYSLAQNMYLKAKLRNSQRNLMPNKSCCNFSLTSFISDLIIFTSKEFSSLLYFLYL